MAGRPCCQHGALVVFILSASTARGGGFRSTVPPWRGGDLAEVVPPVHRLNGGSSSTSMEYPGASRPAWSAPASPGWAASSSTGSELAAGVDGLADVVGHLEFADSSSSHDWPLDWPPAKRLRPITLPDQRESPPPTAPAPLARSIPPAPAPLSPACSRDVGGEQRARAAPCAAPATAAADAAEHAGPARPLAGDGGTRLETETVARTRDKRGGARAHAATGTRAAPAQQDSSQAA